MRAAVKRQPVEPLFDSPRTALRFALGHHMALPRPMMNKMMATGQVQRIELADGTKITVALPRGKPRNEQLRGLDGAGTAGGILLHLARLPEPQQLVLMGSSMVALLPCACRAPCCSGVRPNPEWLRSVLKLCEYLRDEAVLSRLPGKKGMSVRPELRQMLVEKYFLPERKISPKELALRFNVSQSTILNHQRPIVEFLERQADLGWPAFDEHLAEAGILGFLG